MKRRGPRPQRRLLALLVVLVLSFGAISARLAVIQGFDSAAYAEVGHSQRLRSVTLPAERGTMADRNGHDLAVTVRRKSVWANPRLVTDPRREAEALAPILQTSAAKLQDKLSGDGSFAYLARKVNDDVAARIEALKLDGVFFIDEPTRVLPAGGLAAPVIGKVGLDNDGQSGLERLYEEELAGRPGRLVVERDAQGSEIPGGVRRIEQSARGADLELTIDRSLQYEAERTLADQLVRTGSRAGVAMVMEAATGEILALANLTRAYPRRGGESLGEPAPAERATALTDVFEPGSVNKLITVAGALDAGVIRPTDRLSIASTIKVGNHLFSEHDPHPVQQWSITEIVANSSNVGAITIAHRLGKERLNGYLRAFGLGQRTALKFPGETAGLLAPPSKWYSTDMGTIPIGQGGVSVTAMQMLAAYNAVANGGLYVAPKLVRATIDEDGRRRATLPSPERRVISADTAREMTAMLNEVVRVGTGKLAAVNGYTVAGKTGTARKPLPGGKGYEAGAYVSSFAGFVPSEKPAFTIMVMLDEPTPIYGGLVAAPVFGALAGYALRQFRVPPPPPAAPTDAPSITADGAQPVGEVDVPATTLQPSSPQRP